MYAAVSCVDANHAAAIDVVRTANPTDIVADVSTCSSRGILRS